MPICAPRMYKGSIDSTVNRITGFADMIQITHLKLQQVIARMVPRWCVFRYGRTC